MQEVFIEFSSLHWKLCFFQTFKAFCSFDAPFDSILKKYRSFATVHYSLVATRAVFAELKQLKADCPRNRHTYRQTHWQATVTIAVRLRKARLISNT